MGVVFSGMFGIGIIMYTSITTNQHLDHVLFGNMLGVGAQDLWTAGLISAFVTAFLVLKWKDLLLHAFDPAQAQASGLHTGVLHYGLLAVLSLTIVATLTATKLPPTRFGETSPESRTERCERVRHTSVV